VVPKATTICLKGAVVALPAMNTPAGLCLDNLDRRGAKSGIPRLL